MAGSDGGEVWRQVAERLRVVVDAVVGLDLDAMGEQAVREWTAAVQAQQDRLDGAKRRAAGVLTERARMRMGPGRESRARREVDEFLTDELRLPPSEAKKASRTGSELARDAELHQAVDQGRLRPDHVGVIVDATRDLEPETAAQVRDALVAAAGEQDPTELGRTARRLRGRHAPVEAEEAHRRSYRRRAARVTQRPDGTAELWLRTATGLDAELLHTYVDAYRTPDAAGEHRSPEQATYDAIITAMRAGLDAGTAPESHGVRPHVTVTVAAADLDSGTGVGEGAWTGPITMDEVRRLLRNAAVAFVVIDEQRIPLSASRPRSQVPAALWRALQVRDGGCRWPGCRAPAAHCDVAHGGLAAAAGGVLSVGNAVLLCRRHHRKVDQPGWRIDIRGPDITFIDPSGHRTRAGPPHRTALVTEPRDPQLPID